MKISYRFNLIILSALFSYSSPSNPAPADPGPDWPYPNSPGINTEYLCQHWVHSFEEQKQTEKSQIYRTSDFKQFPPSRFRMQYIFYKNGDCEWYYLSPDDGHHFKRGRWRVDAHDKRVLQIIKDDTTESYRIIELTQDRLRMAIITPHKRAAEKTAHEEPWDSQPAMRAVISL